MALIDRKVSDWSQSVSSLDDKPQMTAVDLKAAFDSNSNQLKPAINGIIDDLTGTDGANNIGLTAIDGVDGETVQAVFESLSAFAKNTYDDLAKLSTADGAGLVGVSPISGVSGETVQAVLQNLATLAKNNKLNLEKISSADGAELVGVSPISGVSGETVQAVLQSLYNQIIEIDTGDPNPAQYIKKTEKGAADGIASLDSNGKVPESQLPQLDFIKNSEKGVAGGVATLGEDGFLSLLFGGTGAGTATGARTNLEVAKSVRTEVTFPTSDWSLSDSVYTQTVTCSVAKETMKYASIGIKYSTDSAARELEKEAYALIAYVDTLDGHLKATCWGNEKPQVNLTLIFEGGVD